MPLSDNRQIQALLTSIDSSLEQLNELERSYQNHHERLTGEVAGSVLQLGQLADSQALRALIIRELYWNKDIPADIIGRAFGLQTHRMIKIAGTLTIELPCGIDECDGVVQRTFTSRTDRENYFREMRGRRASHHRPDQLCNACNQREKDESERKAAQHRAALRLRDEQLRNMSWTEFIETKEWIGVRNAYLYEVGYRCEVCHAGDVTLHIQLKKSSVYGHPSAPQTNLEGGAYCGSCKERCLDLLDAERGEMIKAEFLPHLSDWYHEHRFDSDL